MTTVDMSRAAFMAWLRQFPDDATPCEGGNRCVLERYAYGPGDHLPHAHAVDVDGRPSIRKVPSGLTLGGDKAWSDVFRRAVDAGPGWEQQTAGQWRQLLSLIPAALDDQPPSWRDDGEYNLSYAISRQVFRD